MGTEAQGTRDREPAGLVCRSNGLTLRSLDAEKRSVEVIASSESLDSHDEVVEQKWDFSRFKENPVILWAHNRAPGHNGLPIGKAEDWRVEQGKTGPQLVMRIVFATHAFAEEVWGMFRDGFLRAVSVGFKPRDVRLEKRGGDEVFVLSNNELFELSAVPIGSNPDALARSHDSISHLKDAARLGAREVQPAITAEEKRNDMSDAEKDLKDLRASLEESRGETKAATIKLTELEKSLATITTERDAAVARAEKAEKARAKTELDALQGKKFLPAEREDIDNDVKDLGIDRVLKSLSKRADLPVLSTIVKDDSNPNNEVTKGAQPLKLAERLSKVGS